MEVRIYYYILHQLLYVHMYLLILLRPPGKEMISARVVQHNTVRY